MLTLFHLDVFYLKGVWQSLEELASRIHLSIAALSGAGNFLEENHFEFDILKEAGVTEMIMFAVGVVSAFATIELFQAKLAFEVP